MARPGSLFSRFRTVDKAEEAARDVVEVLGSSWLSKSGPSKEVPKPIASAVLQAGRLLDWTTINQIPMPAVVLRAIMCALRVESAVRRIEAAAEARAWAGNMTVREIAKAVGFSERQIYAWRKEAPAYPEWASDKEAIAAARAVASECKGSRGEAERYPPSDGAFIVYSALRWFAHQGLPLPEGLWWCGLCAMGLADYEVGLLDSTIEGTRGTARYPEAIHLMARWDAESDFAGKPRRSDVDMIHKLWVHYVGQRRPVEPAALEALREECPEKLRMVPERNTVARYRSSEGYERHVADAAIYVRIRNDPRTAMEKQKAWNDLVAAVKAEDDSKRMDT